MPSSTILPESGAANSWWSGPCFSPCCSDRAADRWREDYAITGVETLDLQHLYRAMAWLGEELPAKDQDRRTPFKPRCLKDVIEERLFAHRCDLFTRLDLLFLDTTSLYFEGAGGQTLGRDGYSKNVAAKNMWPSRNLQAFPQ